MDSSSRTSRNYRMLLTFLDAVIGIFLTYFLHYWVDATSLVSSSLLLFLSFSDGHPNFSLDTPPFTLLLSHFSNLSAHPKHLRQPASTSTVSNNVALRHLTRQQFLRLRRYRHILNKASANDAISVIRKQNLSKTSPCTARFFTQLIAAIDRPTPNGGAGDRATEKRGLQLRRLRRRRPVFSQTPSG